MIMEIRLVHKVGSANGFDLEVQTVTKEVDLAVSLYPLKLAVFKACVYHCFRLSLVLMLFFCCTVSMRSNGIAQPRISIFLCLLLCLSREKPNSKAERD